MESGVAVSLMWFDSEEDRAEAVSELKQMHPSARRLLAETVGASGVTRKKASDAALALENAGFVRMWGVGFGDEEVRIVPTLWGEEALEVLDDEKDEAGKRV